MASDPTNSVPSATALSDAEIAALRDRVSSYDNYPVTIAMRAAGCADDRYEKERRILATIDALCERERELRETLVDAESWVTDLKMRRVIAELLAAKEDV